MRLPTRYSPTQQPDWGPESDHRVVGVSDQHKEQWQRRHRRPEEGGDAREDGERTVSVAVRLAPVHDMRVPGQWKGVKQ